ncbi:hypothetical protein K435DRAFT_967532 [Dendrothele bispora CBS 962.96]|uniref:Uncharacterized protein n=1 Tax=Dendrothele bispora (strain CBS 962.96) TaxID=1314807 RepID=A0A4S8LTJ0_DENBC|nr:hypothetical protein K435DRAFT_967532 [Dendrothele bispora CBS 962.96]
MRPTSVLSQSLLELHSLIKRGHYAAAARVRDLLVHSGETIPPHTIYRRPLGAAIRDLSSNKATEENLYNWVHLLPTKHELRRQQEKQFSVSDEVEELSIDLEPTKSLPADPFQHPGLRDLYTFDTPHKRLPVAFNVCKIASSKGFFHSILPHFVRYIGKVSTPVGGTRMMLALEEAALEYEREHIMSLPSRFGDTFKQRKFARVRKNLKSTVIRTCCQVGWAREAKIVMKRYEHEEEPLVLSEVIHDLVRTATWQKKSRGSKGGKSKE